MKFFIFVSIILLKHYGIFASLEYEKQLHKRLLDDYNPDVRPEPGHNEPVEVHLDVRIKKLIKLDVRTQVLVINAFTMLRWVDPQLKWKADLYAGVDYITMGSNLIWTPDIVLYNTADETSQAHTDYYKTKVTIFETGKVVWTAPVTWQVSCPFDVTWFPVDRQICNLTFGSWTYSKSQIRLVSWSEHTETVINEHFHVKSGEWKILKIDTFYKNISFVCCPEAYSAVVYEFHGSRLSLYYFMYILLPLISLAFLFLLVFFIPYNSGERMGFGVTILLSITVYLLVISEQLPEKSDDKSMLGICFIIEFYLLCAALAMSLATTNLSRRITKPPSYLLELYLYIKRSPCKKNCLKLCRKEKYEPEAATELDQLAGYCENNNQPQYPNAVPMTRKEHFYNNQWNAIAALLDKCLFYLFLMLMAIVPLIVTSKLDKTNLGSM